MIQLGCSLLGSSVADDRYLDMEDYQKAVPRWCSGCGDHAVLTAVQRLLEHEQLPLEDTVFVSGIGCSSRFPHYVNSYGFHGLHGRALPVATGVKLRRPELNVFAVMGDGDCCSIGAGHWVHTTRYNPNIVAIMLDNGVYGLTKNQTSPTSPKGHKSNTQPKGALLDAMNPIATTLGVENASFVAQTGDWAPDHIYETLRMGFHHEGFAFIRILQRCPQYTDDLFLEAMRNPDSIELLVHPNGVQLPELEKLYTNTIYHDPADKVNAFRLAQLEDKIRLGVFYRNEELPAYEKVRAVPAKTADEKIAILNAELDKYAV
jgi:2-oxoglutarate ferredoxin oxidoreductase subunit beta